MKNLFSVALLLLGSNFLNAQNQTSLEADGNLESPKPCGCVTIVEVSNENNPADILAGVEKCVESKQFDKAARLFAIAAVFGRYDTFRVKDKSAHQALKVLQMRLVGQMNETDRNALLKSIEKELASGSKELDAICQSIRQVGIPKYHPKYMIQHGIEAFTNTNGNGLVEDFNSEESWNKALKDYLHCGG
ncbi:MULTISPECIES: hypothetical protein [unclassified Flavobacterium]|uniref:hypothetical protein n=1 Tax=unclassified Flavobacterium TaxID=196869 RepID=UPI001F136144|nr:MULTISPECIES: hypothetical protein [unclassified Flavobacterium]UMY65106.1 hypothetical protein MKO97_11370 [Flavobacterium sp. HJ-32-4]